MPIERAPGRTFSTGVEGVQNLHRAQEVGKRTLQNGVSNAVITEVRANGAYRVAGIERELFTTGDAKGLLVGMIVQVGWRHGEPQAILSHNARRAQFTPPPPSGVPGVELLLAAPAVSGDITGTKLDVWFRNQNQTTLLNVREKIAAAGFVGGAPGFTSIIGLELLGWGLDQRRFVVSFGNPIAAGVTKSILAVFKFTVPRSTITAPAKVVLERTYDLGTLTNVLGTTSYLQTSPGGVGGSMTPVLGSALEKGWFLYISNPTLGTVSVSIGSPGNFTMLQIVTAGLASVVLTKDKHLIANFRVGIGNNYGQSQVPPAEWFFPFVVDLTTGTTLFNGFNARTTWGLPDSQIFDGVNFSVGSGGGFNTFTSFKGGASVHMVPTPAGNVLRFFATGTGLAGNNASFKWAGVRIGLGPLTLVFSESAPGPTVTTVGVGVRSTNSRHVMWLRVANVVPPASLSSYNFKEGLHITDLGPGEALAVTDAVVLADRDSIITLMDETPYLVRPQLLWLGRNDLRTVEPAGAVTLAALLVAAGLAGVSAGPRRKTKFASYTTGSGSPTVPIAPPASGTPLVITLPPGLAVTDLKPIPTAAAFLAVDVLDNYDVSGHQDPVVGAEIYVSNPGRSRVQYMTPNGET